MQQYSVDLLFCSCSFPLHDIVPPSFMMKLGNRFCSLRVRGAAPPRAHGGRPKSAMEEGDRLASVSHRSHRRIRSVATGVRGRHQHGGHSHGLTPLTPIGFSGTHHIYCNCYHTQVMGTQLRRDILMNIPALRKLDAMLLVRKFLGSSFRDPFQQFPESKLMFCVSGTGVS